MLSTEFTVSTLAESTVSQVSTDVESTLSVVLEQPLPQLEQRAMIAKAKINNFFIIKNGLKWKDSRKVARVVTIHNLFTILYNNCIHNIDFRLLFFNGVKTAKKNY